MPHCLTSSIPRRVRSPGHATCQPLERLGHGWFAYGELVEAESGERTPCGVSTTAILSCGVWLSTGVTNRKRIRNKRFADIKSSVVAVLAVLPGLCRASRNEFVELPSVRILLSDGRLHNPSYTFKRRARQTPSG